MGQSAEALVLTEWKRAPSSGDVADKAREGRSQAQSYAAGVLGGLELASVRYVVVVTEDWTDPLPDEIGEGVTYRYLGIAVKPSSPSRRSRRTS